MSRYFRLNLVRMLMALFIFSVVMTTFSLAKKLPDLDIVKITVDQDCNLAVVVRNNGPGLLPDYVYTKHHPKSAGVYVFINGNKWGGQTIWKFDPTKTLQRPGGMKTCILNYKVGAPINVKAVVDYSNDVKEANEKNNTEYRRQLSCEPAGGKKLPDLVVRNIELVDDCKIKVTISNIGGAGVPDSYYDLPDAVAIQMYNGTKPWGGMILKMFDPTKKLKTPGSFVSHVWFPQAANLNLGAGTHTLKVEVDVHKKLTELSETNNILTKRVSCKKAFGSIGTVVGSLNHFSISNIRFTPTSPASLNFDDRVNIKFDYKCSEGVHIFARPMTQGSLTPNYAAHPSKLYPKGSGGGEGFFTIKKGKVTVDQVRFQMKDKNLKKVLYEKFVPVKFSFPKSVLSVSPGVVTTTMPQLTKAPKQFFLDFTDAYLAFVNPSKSIQIIAQNNVLSYGSDWEKCQLKPYLYHIRQKFWKGFFWQVNTSRKEVYEVTGGSFCKLGGKQIKLDITVDVVGGSTTTPPDRFFLRFKEAHIVYMVSTKTMQLITGNKVLSYCQDWEKCQLTNTIYHFREKFWKGFIWKVDTLKKKVWKVNGIFCKPNKGGTLLNIGVRVIN